MCMKDTKKITFKQAKALARKIEADLLDGGQRLAIIKTPKESTQADGLPGWGEGVIADRILEILWDFA